MEAGNLKLETDDGPKCPECGCRMEWAECEVCGGEGVDGHDCGEDCCCCADPEDNIPCDCCSGEGGRWVCEACTSNVKGENCHDELSSKR